MEDQIEIEYQISLADFLEFKKLQKQLQQIRSYNAYLMDAIFIGAILITLYEDLRLLAILFAVGYFLAFYTERIKKTDEISDYKNQEFEGASIKFSAEKEGILFATGYTSTRASWKAFMKLDEGQTIFVFWLNPVTGFIIPKDAFANDEELKSFKSFVASSLPPWMLPEG